LSAGATASPSVASNCGFNVYILEDVIVYNGTLLVTQSDTLASIRSQTLIRNTTSPLSLSITFPRYAAVNASSLTIFAPIDVEAAIVVQDYDVTTDSGLFQMLVSVEYPFKFSSVTMRSSGGAGINVYPSIADSQEGYQCLAASEDCSVLYDLYVNGTFCALSGFFAVEFGISCRAGVVNCPLQGGENANVTWTATSTNLCGSVNRNVSLSVGLASYLNSEMSTARQGFLIGQTMYFEATASSTDVTISVANVFLKNCTLFFGEGSPTTTPLVILEGGEFGSAATSSVGSDVQILNADGNQMSIFASTQLFTVPTDYNISVVVECYIGVQYNNVAYSKRFILGGDNKDLPKLPKRQVTPTFSQTDVASAQVDLASTDVKATQDTVSSANFSNPLFFLILVISLSLLL